MTHSILQRLKTLETAAAALEPNRQHRQPLNKATLDYANNFLEQLEEKKAYEVTTDKGKGIHQLAIEEQPKDIQTLLAALEEHVDFPGLNPASAGHIAYIPGGGLYPSALGDYLAAVFNRYAGIFYASPGAVRLENQLLQWLCNCFGLPKGASGNLTSGGSMANLIAITTARDHYKIPAKDFDKIVVYATQQVHHCVWKSLKTAGLGESIRRLVPMDDQFRMDPQALAEQIAQDRAAGLRPFMVFASVGTTDTGAIDPLDAIADICDQKELWFHIDAAYGGFFVLAPEAKTAFKGIERAHSIVVDPHKGLFLPYGSGAVLIRDASWLYDSQHMEANYMQDTVADVEELSPADLSPELTKPFRGLRLWMPLQLFGLAPFRAALSEKIWLCRYFYEQIQQIEGFEVGPFPELSVMIYRYVPKTGDADAYNLGLIEQVKADGKVFLSSTTIDGKVYLRLAVLSFRTHLRHVEYCLKLLQELTAGD